MWPSFLARSCQRLLPADGCLAPIRKLGSADGGGLVMLIHRATWWILNLTRGHSRRTRKGKKGRWGGKKMYSMSWGEKRRGMRRNKAEEGEEREEEDGGGQETRR